MTHDLVVANGTVVDGTGAPRRRADVAIDGDRITAVTEPGDAGAAHRTIDAEGRYVTPGFVDLHSHLDAQIGWDPLMSSSCWHGVTSVVMGNCGMTFAPVRPGGAEVLAQAMESVEDIPASCILDGLPWSWESYAEYLDVVDALPKGINTGGYVGDVALRNYVIGDAACEPDHRATDDELAAMAREVERALDAGALGLLDLPLTHPPRARRPLGARHVVGPERVLRGRRAAGPPRSRRPRVRAALQRDRRRDPTGRRGDGVDR